jgi:hypothetical protein
MRWTWIGLAIVSTIGYLWMNPLIVVVSLREEEDEDRVGPGREDEAENAEELEEGEEVDEEQVLVDTEVGEDGAAEEPLA